MMKPKIKWSRIDTPMLATIVFCLIALTIGLLKVTYDYNHHYGDELEIKAESIIYTDNVISSEKTQQIKSVVTYEHGNFTAYCPCEECCGRWAYSNTVDGVTYGAYGTALTSGYSVASDYYEAGTIIYIIGYGEVEVMDKFGGDNPQSRFDIFFSSHEAAQEFGRQHLSYYVVGE